MNSQSKLYEKDDSSGFSSLTDFGKALFNQLNGAQQQLTKIRESLLMRLEVVTAIDHALTGIQRTLSLERSAHGVPASAVQNTIRDALEHIDRGWAHFDGIDWGR